MPSVLRVNNNKYDQCKETTLWNAHESHKILHDPMSIWRKSTRYLTNTPRNVDGTKDD